MLKIFEFIQLASDFNSSKVDVEGNWTKIEKLVFRMIERVFNEIGINKLNNNTEKCFTEFTVLFDLEPFEEENIYCDFLIKANKVKVKF